MRKLFLWSLSSIAARILPEITDSNWKDEAEEVVVKVVEETQRVGIRGR